MNHLFLEVNDVKEDADNGWVHSFKKHHLPDSLHDVAKEAYLELFFPWDRLPLLVLTCPFEAVCTFDEEFFDLCRGRSWIAEDVCLGPRCLVLVLDLVVVVEWPVQTPELFYNRHALFQDLRDVVGRAPQLGPHEDESRAQIPQLLPLHVHRVSVLVGFQIVRHHETCQCLEFDLVDVREAVKEPC